MVHGARSRVDPERTGRRAGTRAGAGACAGLGDQSGTELLLYRGDGPTPFDPSLDPPGLRPIRAATDTRGSVRWSLRGRAGASSRGRGSSRSRPTATGTCSTRAPFTCSTRTSRRLAPFSPRAWSRDHVRLGFRLLDRRRGGRPRWRLGGAARGVAVGLRRRTRAAGGAFCAPAGGRARLGVNAVAPGEDEPAGADIVFEATGDPALSRAPSSTPGRKGSSSSPRSTARGRRPSRSARTSTVGGSPCARARCRRFLPRDGRAGARSAASPS